MRYQNGQLLLEILVVVAVVSVIAALGAQALYVSMAGHKISGERNNALGLLNETFEAVRSIATEKWQLISGLTKNSQYHAEIAATTWITGAGSETISLSNTIYTRSFIVQNVCRQTGDIRGITDSGGTSATCVDNGGSHDPSTQKVTVTIQWLNGNEISTGEYISRWRNKVCNQTGWSAGGASGVSTCPDTVFDVSTNITPSATDLQLCSGGC